MTKILKTVSALAIAATLTTATLVTGSVASAKPFLHLGHGPVVTSKLPPAYLKIQNRLKISCLACNLPRPMPHPMPGPRPTHNWNNGWHHGFGWYNRPGYYVGAVPAAVTVAAPVQSVPAYAPIASQVAAGPCSCLTKQDLPDGGVLFQDICTKQSAIASPLAVGAR